LIEIGATISIGRQKTGGAGREPGPAVVSRRAIGGDTSRYRSAAAAAF